MTEGSTARNTLNRVAAAGVVVVVSVISDLLVSVVVYLNLSRKYYHILYLDAPISLKISSSVNRLNPNLRHWCPFSGHSIAKYVELRQRLAIISTPCSDVDKYFVIFLFCYVSSNRI